MKKCVYFVLTLLFVTNFSSFSYAQVTDISSVFAQGGHVRITYDGQMQGRFTANDGRSFPVSGAYRVDVTYNGNSVSGSDSLTFNSPQWRGGTTTFQGTRTGNVCDITDSNGLRIRSVCTFDSFTYDQTTRNSAGSLFLALDTTRTKAVNVLEQPKQVSAQSSALPSLGSAQRALSWIGHSPTDIIDGTDFSGAIGIEKEDLALKQNKRIENIRFDKIKAGPDFEDNNGRTWKTLYYNFCEIYISCVEKFYGKKTYKRGAVYIILSDYIGINGERFFFPKLYTLAPYYDATHNANGQQIPELGYYYLATSLLSGKSPYVGYFSSPEVYESRNRSADDPILQAYSDEKLLVPSLGSKIIVALYDQISRASKQDRVLKDAALNNQLKHLEETNRERRSAKCAALKREIGVEKARCSD